MTRSGHPTVMSSVSNVVVLVGGMDELKINVAQAAAAASGANLTCCELKDAASTAAKVRPFALVIADELYAFDPEEFEALARDIGAELVTANEDTPPEQLVAWFTRAAVRLG